MRYLFFYISRMSQFYLISFIHSLNAKIATINYFRLLQLFHISLTNWDTKETIIIIKAQYLIFHVILFHNLPTYTLFHFIQSPWLTDLGKYVISFRGAHDQRILGQYKWKAYHMTGQSWTPNIFLETYPSSRLALGPVQTSVHFVYEV